jgi:hypothetical protein
MSDDPYTTRLNETEEMRYQIWRAMLPQPLQYDGDYDLRGAYKDGLKPTDSDHFNDKYKKPNHVTFSDQSMYSTPENPGGTWAGDDNGGVFWASPANLKNNSMDGLQEYFTKREPKWKVVAPSDFKLQPGK